MFQRFYESFYQHPLLLWAVPVVFLFFIPRRADFFSLYLWFFTLESITDALLTGPGPAWLGLSDQTARDVAIFFVIFGDTRFFLIIEYFGRAPRKLGEDLPREDLPREGLPRDGLPRDGLPQASRAKLHLPGLSLQPFATAVAWSFVVPVLQLLLIRLFPGFFSESRYTFLAYEVLFFFVAWLFRDVLFQRRELEPRLRPWLRDICGYAMTYYAFWATADVLILGGDLVFPGLSDWGFGLRVVPNVLYYGLFLPFVFWRAPLELKENAGDRSSARVSSPT